MGQPGALDLTIPSPLNPTVLSEAYVRGDRQLKGINTKEVTTNAKRQLKVYESRGK